MTETQALLTLGPIVGHTDSRSSRVWIRVDGPIDGWSLAVDGRSFPFLTTEAEHNEFGTAMAVAEGFSSDTVYPYRVEHECVGVATGSFRTMPAEDSGADSHS